MSKTSVYDGEVFKGAAAPSGGLVSGQGYQLGQIFGVVVKDAATGAAFELAVEGVWDLPKLDDNSEPWSTGVLLYWDATAGVVTSVASLNLLIGVAVADAEHDAAVGRVRLNGLARAQNPT